MSASTLKSLWYRLCRWVCRIFCTVCFDFRIYGTENLPRRGGFLLVSNHQSFFDPVFCGVFINRRLHYLARDTLFTNRFFGWFIRLLNAIPVKRGRADVGAVKKAIEKLQTGQALCLFPEGTRTYDGRIAPLRPGFGLLCRRTKVPVVPMVIDGAFEAWPRHRVLPSLARRIVVCYGKPIHVEAARHLDERQLVRRLTQILRQMHNICRKRHGRKPYDYSEESAEMTEPPAEMKNG